MKNSIVDKLGIKPVKIFEHSYIQGACSELPVVIIKTSDSRELEQQNRDMVEALIDDAILFETETGQQHLLVDLIESITHLKLNKIKGNYFE